tara:strand:+ start:30353 stop:31585 length:1233 start_codon:yes stop_codon:yes gene_type:complete
MKKQLVIEGGNVPFIKQEFDLGATYSEEESAAIQEVISSGTISGFVANSGQKFFGGPKVIELEQLFKEYFDVDYAVASNSATSSLHCAISSLGIGPGDEVIVPALSMSASATSIIMSGATPVFIDIEDSSSTSFNLNASQLKEKLSDKTKAILVVHLFGIPAQMDEVMLFAKENNLFVIEDCAQSPGILFNSKYTGTLGDVGIFSFNQSKTMSSGEGGVAIAKDENVALRMQLMRNHAEAMIEDFPQAKMENLIGYNYRITDLEAAVAIEQFKKLDKFNSRKIDLANEFSIRLEKIEGLRGINKILSKENAVFIYPIIFQKEFFSVDRDYFVEACQKEGIPLVPGYTKPIVDLPLFKDYLGKDDFENARSLHYERLISAKFCHHKNVSNQDIDMISDAIEYVVSLLKKKD